MALFESYERRIDKINGVLAQYGISSVEECRDICKAKGFDPYEIVKGIQPICFENACWAYTVGAAIALKKNVKTAAEAAEAIGIGLQAFCIDGSVAEDRKVGLGHGNLGAMLLRDETKCFAFLAGHDPDGHPARQQYVRRQTVVDHGNQKHSDPHHDGKEGAQFPGENQKRRVFQLCAAGIRPQIQVLNLPYK